ncbi:hypothetical protein POM88_054809 [Heracleum sosnowskyi]|uniref:Uncharacterized protein n=1 Tax=Heracleum sosnowskyi TaxID=360622 RepID=A0AAD8LWH3_9APIA|nr:hypothetical protein POM88_054809 [Heracleum sosnowskyi]
MESQRLATVSTIISNNSWNTSRSNHVLAMKMRQLLSVCSINSIDKLSLNDWEVGEFFVSRQTGFLRNIGYLFISAMIYIVWLERNSRIHNPGHSKNVEKMVYLVKQMVREKIFTIPSAKKTIRKNPHLVQLLY